MPDGYESIGSKNRRKRIPLGELCDICNQRHTRCTAHRRKARDEETGLPLPCGGTPVPGMSVCHFHGGKSLVGPANPNFRGGAYANPRFLPSRFLDTAQEIRDDPEHGTMKRAILLCELRIDELLHKIDERTGLGTIDEIRDALFDLRVSYESGDEEETVDALNTAIKLVDGNEKSEGKAWKELRSTMGDMRRAVDSERKRQIVIGDYIPREQVVNLAREIMGIVSKYVPDPHAKSEMLREIASRVDRTSRAAREDDTSPVVDAEYRQLGEGVGEGVEINGANGLGARDLHLAEDDDDSDDDGYEYEDAAYEDGAAEVGANV